MRRALLTLVLACALVGCGGDDQLTADEYRTELRKICVETKRQTDGVEPPLRVVPAAIADYLTRLRDITAKAVDDVDDLEPPDDLQDAHERVLASDRESRKEIDAVIAQLEDGADPTQVLTEVRNDLRRLEESGKRAAREIGVTECVT